MITARPFISHRAAELEAQIFRPGPVRMQRRIDYLQRAASLPALFRNDAGARAIPEQNRNVGIQRLRKRRSGHLLCRDDENIAEGRRKPRGHRHAEERSRARNRQIDSRHARNSDGVSPLRRRPGKSPLGCCRTTQSPYPDSAALMPPRFRQSSAAARLPSRRRFPRVPRCAVPRSRSWSRSRPGSQPSLWASSSLPSTRSGS